MNTDLIKQLRRDRKIKAGFLAAKIGRSVSYYRNVENGIVPPMVELEIIADILRVQPADLIIGKLPSARLSA